MFLGHSHCLMPGPGKRLCGDVGGGTTGWTLCVLCRQLFCPCVTLGNGLQFVAMPTLGLSLSGLFLPGSGTH